ncbi:glycerol-3-phosphate dehydrogenase [Paracoccus sp. SCSIO 75233]|uniref:glycerol-3-phosphate dehydrogenase n=1 Tax=Paracoccus sp. SCSIO 75233 TaxID=3017782 RepID=UPI0022F0D515|nr:glycerol-3-phosphate dehydrogenase [Paracoccus sp. SCSIO 75233]WBU54564.1 glycerol-3-phosphate dehydrogenase [Paracoccus sp. SCSIO 75233]
MSDPVDLFIIGGGINGCGIARDAAGRGLSVRLAEKDDLAQATSSRSTKLFHGGLRYLEYFEFRLVREALHEREILLRAMPHISWPMRFVLPVLPDMRFDSDTPTSRLLGLVMPWMKGRRPAWLIRLGLFIYDHLGGRQILPKTRKLDLSTDPAGAPLKSGARLAYEYSDCWVQDARLVVLNARDAAARGADIRTRTRVESAIRDGDLWRIETVTAAGQRETHSARALVNAAGPWVGQVIEAITSLDSTERVRLVRGSHIVVPRIAGHDRCYFFQGPDGRIIFAIPYEQEFTLIGTTDAEHDGSPQDPEITAEEIRYLCDFASRYFADPVRPEDIVWSYAGVRSLYDDGAKSATAATRDYVLSLDEDGPPALNVFGGKITTYRRLAESALKKLAPHFPDASSAWTAGAPLPGGDFPVDGADKLIAELRAAHGFGAMQAERLIRAYGTEAATIFADGPGADLGGGLTEAELNWLTSREWAQTAEDVIWRRSKLGLKMSGADIAALRDRLGQGAEA